MTPQQLAEEAARIKGKTLAEYMKAPRIGASFPMNRKARKAFYTAMKQAAHLPLWAEADTGHTVFGTDTYLMEEKILRQAEKHYGDAY